MTPALDLMAFELSQDDIWEAVSKELGCGGDDLLLACGSLVEGLGNAKSDLDLCLVTSRAPPLINPATNRAVVIGGRLVSDILFVHPDAIAELGRRLEALYAGARDLRAAAKQFTYFEHRLLHRLANSVPLQRGAEPAERHRIITELAPSRHLGRLKLDRAHYEASALQLDLAGLRDEGQWASMIFAAQDVLGWAIDGLLGAHGLTNPTPKWRIKLLELLDETAIGRLPGFAETSPVDLVLDLNRAPNTVSPESAVGHALRIVGFSRSVFFWGDQAISGSPAVPNFAGPVGIGDDSQTLLPALDIDADFKPSGSGFDLVRKNRAPGRLHLTFEEAALACIFNGTTTDAQARRGIEGEDEHGLSAASIESLASLLEGAELVVRPLADERAIRETIDMAFYQAGNVIGNEVISQS